jgi:glucan phosphoethanolaminetransferase (alkaline phosphatase superfamily)
MTPIASAVVALYDELLYLRTLLLHNLASELLIAIYFLASFFAAVAMLLYWSFCAAQLLQSASEELTDAELESLRMDRRVLITLLYLIFPKAIALH